VIRRYRTIDAHAAGAPLRLIVEGFPTVKGGTMAEKRVWVQTHADGVRRALLLEPRGHGDMTGAILTEPVTPEADAGILFMHADGIGAMCGHGVIAAATIALERGLIRPRRAATIVFDTVAGRVTATGRVCGGASADEPVRVDAVSFLNVPSFVLAPGLGVVAAGRQVRADVAYGGALYAIVDAEAVGLPIARTRLGDLRRAGVDIRQAAQRELDRLVADAQIAEGDFPDGVNRVSGTVFTGPSDEESSDLIGITVFGDGQLDRSPGGTSVSAVMAVLDAMGLLEEGQTFRQAGVAGTVFRGRIAGRSRHGAAGAVLPELEGSAWITGEHTFLVADGDPLGQGFRLPT
jgi:proline racemase